MVQSPPFFGYRQVPGRSSVHNVPREGSNGSGYVQEQSSPMPTTYATRVANRPGSSLMMPPGAFAPTSMNVPVGGGSGTGTFWVKQAPSRNSISNSAGSSLQVS